MNCTLTIDATLDQLPAILEALQGLEWPPDSALIPEPDTRRPTRPGNSAEVSSPIPPDIERYLTDHGHGPALEDSRRLLTEATTRYTLLPGGSKSVDYVMVFRRGPRQVGALAYLMLQGELRLRLPKESAADYPHARANPNQRLYQVEIPVSAPIEELLAVLEEANQRAQLPDRWNGDPEVEARRAAARRARQG